MQLEVKPTEPGEKTYIIETPLQPDEADKEDNRLERKVFVREAKLIKVLYVEGYRRYEYHYPQDSAGARERPDQGQQEHRPQGGAAERRPRLRGRRTARRWRRFRPRRS